MEPPLLEAAEARAAEVEAGGDELHVPLLQDIFDHLRHGSQTNQSIPTGAEGGDDARVD